MHTAPTCRADQIKVQLLQIIAVCHDCTKGRTSSGVASTPLHSMEQG